MKKFEVTLTRQIEETCVVKIDAKNADEAAEKAIDIGGEVAELIWCRDDNIEPHTLSVYDVVDMEHKEIP